MPPRGHLEMAGDIFGCHISEEGKRYWYLVGERPGRLLNVLQCTHRCASTTKSDRVNRAEAEKPWSTEIKVAFFIPP